MYSEQSLSKGQRLIHDAVDRYEDFIEANLKEDADPRTKAQMGMMLAVVAISQVIQESGLRTAIIQTYRSFKAARVLEKAIRDAND